MDNKLKIINYLGKNIKKAYTMNELSKLLKIPYATFYRTLSEMEDVILINSVGKARTVQLNSQNQAVKSYLAISSHEERKEYLKKQPIINKIASELETDDTVILFGSYAKGTQTEKSDIDIMIINKDGKKTISFSKYDLLFRKKINPLFVSRKEFELMLREKEENVGKQALQNQIILNNPEKFWEMVLDAV